MSQINDDDMGFMVEFSDDEIRALYYAVTEALTKWPGSPQRPAIEQELLRNLKMTLFSMTLDMSWQHSEGDSLS